MHVNLNHFRQQALLSGQFNCVKKGFLTALFYTVIHNFLMASKMQSMNSEGGHMYPELLFGINLYLILFKKKKLVKCERFHYRLIDPVVFCCVPDVVLQTNLS